MPAIILFNGIKVEKDEILDYFDEYYLSALELYNRYKRFGLPWACGYQETPEYLITIYEMFDVTMESYQKWKAEKAKSKRKK